MACPVCGFSGGYRGIARAVGRSHWRRARRRCGLVPGKLCQRASCVARAAVGLMELVTAVQARVWARRRMCSRRSLGETVQ
ncbi:hypothetical protein [Salinisphaera sp. Q1T1-3]|uniref:hypothetical protein n=1 Tax=Salinisphaera sp. Q1T1-3 TaxID=2321229 RepID=UPI00351A8921